MNISFKGAKRLLSNLFYEDKFRSLHQQSEYLFVYLFE
jgi:hypothetical protein